MRLQPKIRDRYVLGGNLEGLLVVEGGVSLLDLGKLRLHELVVGGSSTLLLGG